MKMYKMNPLNTDENIRRFSKMLRDIGVEEELKARGAKDGDEVRIDDFVFEYYE
jgi:GTP-binding protein